MRDDARRVQLLRGTRPYLALAGHSCCCAPLLGPTRHWPTPSCGRGIWKKLHQSSLTTPAKLLEQPLWMTLFHRPSSPGFERCEPALASATSKTTEGQNIKNADVYGTVAGKAGRRVMQRNYAAFCHVDAQNAFRSNVARNNAMSRALHADMGWAFVTSRA